jgi:hypothetical protein
MESVNSIPFAGKTITVSFYARAGANYSATSNALAFKIRSGTGTDQNLFGAWTGIATVADLTATLTTTWQRFTVTGSVASTATQLAFYSDFAPTGTAGAADYYELTGVQIDVGNVALPFRTNGATIQGELSAAQRYFQIYPTGSDAQAWSGQFYSTTAARLYKDLPVTMRTSSQTITLPTGTFTNFIEQVGVATRTPTTLTAGSALANRVYFDATGMSSATSGAMAVWAVSNQISISAEL